MYLYNSFKALAARLLTMIWQYRNMFNMSNLDLFGKSSDNPTSWMLFFSSNIIYIILNLGHFAEERSNAIALSIGVMGIILGLLPIFQDFIVFYYILIALLSIDVIVLFSAISCVRIEDLNLVTTTDGYNPELLNYIFNNGNKHTIRFLPGMDSSKRIICNTIAGFKNIKYTYPREIDGVKEIMVDPAVWENLLNKIKYAFIRIAEIESLIQNNNNPILQGFKFEVEHFIVNNLRMLTGFTNGFYENFAIDLNSVTISGEVLELDVHKLTMDNDLENGECFKDMMLSVFDIFKTVYIRVEGKLAANNHISWKPFVGSVPVPVWYAIRFSFLNYYNSDNKSKNKIKVKVSQNLNESMPPCTLSERLNLINEKVPMKNKTTIQLNRYLHYIAHLHHNRYCKPYFITTERKIRWIKHVKWVVGSLPLAPVITVDDNLKIETPKVPEFKPVKLYEIKTITLVDYKEGKEITDKKIVEEEVSVKKISDDEVIVNHVKGNRFVVMNKDTLHKKTVTVPALVHAYFNPRNPQHLSRDNIYSGVHRQHLGDLESGKLFYNEDSKRYHVNETTKIVKKEIVETYKKEDQVFFKDVEIEVPVVSDTLVKYKTQKEHDLNWKKVCRGSLLKKLEDSKNKIVHYNRFSVLKSNNKLKKKTNFKFSNDFITSEDDRDYCKYGKSPVTRKDRNKIIKQESECQFKELFEAVLNVNIRKKLTELVPNRIRYYKRNFMVDMDTAIVGLKKGFLGKRDLKMKKTFRNIVYSCLEDMCYTENLSNRKNPIVSRIYHDDDDNDSLY